MNNTLDTLLGRTRKRVAFCSPLWTRSSGIKLGWSDYWRLAIPAVALAKNGWDVVLARGLRAGSQGQFSVQDTEGNWHDDREIVVFHRWISSRAAEAIIMARAAGQTIINDLDDHFWAFPPNHPGIALMDPARDPDYNWDNYEAILRASSRITVSTPALAEVVGGWGTKVSVVRNRVHLDAWPPRKPGGYIGWVGSTAGRAEDLEILRESVVPWLRERELPFYHGGAIPGEPKMQDVLSYERVLVRHAVSVPHYPRLWDPLRVALCPLGETEFARCKSWVKPLEACARGIPFIASKHPEYRELGTGRFASSPEEWVQHLEALENQERYEADSDANRRCAESHAIEPEGWETWAKVLKEESSVTITWAGEPPVPTGVPATRNA